MIKLNNSKIEIIKNLLFAMSFLFKNYSLVKVTYLLINNTDNTNRNGVNKQNKHTHTHTHTHIHQALREK